MRILTGADFQAILDLPGGMWTEDDEERLVVD